MAHKKKVHRFGDCGSNMGAGNRSEGNLTADIRQVTCGTCKRRITEAVAQLDWSDEELPLALLSSIAARLSLEPEPRRGDKSSKQ